MNNSIEIYRSHDGSVQLNVKLENETVWLSVKQMTLLFDREESNIRRHIINIFREGELDKESNVHFYTFQIQTNQFRSTTSMSSSPLAIV